MKDKKFSLLQNILKALGLSSDAIDDIIERISDFLNEKGDKPYTVIRTGQPEEIEELYFVRDDFLSIAEQSFFQVLQKSVEGWALILPKVSLSDLFYVRHEDPSRYRSLTNKIDRKHVDFLLCDPVTIRPLVGIELDDKSHQRPDRQERDEFVERVFKAAGLPLLRVPVRRSYPMAEMGAWIKHTVELATKKEFATAPIPAPASQEAAENTAPLCPKCSDEMVLRTAKTGANQGGKFWGCPNYPRCRGMLPYSGSD